MTITHEGTRSRESVPGLLLRQTREGGESSSLENIISVLTDNTRDIKRGMDSDVGDSKAQAQKRHRLLLSSLEIVAKHPDSRIILRLHKTLLEEAAFLATGEAGEDGEALLPYFITYLRAINTIREADQELVDQTKEMLQFHLRKVDHVKKDQPSRQSAASARMVKLLTSLLPPGEATTVSKAAQPPRERKYGGTVVTAATVAAVLSGLAASPAAAREPGGGNGQVIIEPATGENTPVVYSGISGITIGNVLSFNERPTEPHLGIEGQNETLPPSTLSSLSIGNRLVLEASPLSSANIESANSVAVPPQREVVVVNEGIYVEPREYVDSGSPTVIVEGLDKRITQAENETPIDTIRRVARNTHSIAKTTTLIRMHYGYESLPVQNEALYEKVGRAIAIFELSTEKSGETGESLDEKVLTLAFLRAVINNPSILEQKDVQDQLGILLSVSEGEKGVLINHLSNDKKAVTLTDEDLKNIKEEYRTDIRALFIYAQYAGLSNYQKEQILSEVERTEQQTVSDTVNDAETESKETGVIGYRLDEIKYFNQGKEAYTEGAKVWGNVDYGSGKIWSDGCAVVASSILSNLSGKVRDPAESKAFFEEVGAFVDGVGSKWIWSSAHYPGAAEAYREFYGLEVDQLGTGEDSNVSEEELMAAISRGSMILITEGKGVFTKYNGHILVIRGMTEDGYFLVADSSGSDNLDNLDGWDRTVEGKFTYEQIIEALKGAWEVSGSASEAKANEIQAMMSSANESDSTNIDGGAEFAIQDAEDKALMDVINTGIENSIFRKKFTPIDGDEFFRIVTEADASFSHPVITRELVTAVVQQESAFTVDAVSDAGAVGIGQFMEGAAKDYGVRDRLDPEQSIYGMYRYLIRSYNLSKERFPNKSDEEILDLTLAGYNAGMWNRTVVQGRVPENGETDRYVDNIGNNYEHIVDDVEAAGEKAAEEAVNNEAEAAAAQEEAAKKEAAEQKAREEAEAAAAQVKAAEQKAREEAEAAAMRPDTSKLPDPVKYSTHSRDSGIRVNNETIDRADEIIKNVTWATQKENQAKIMAVCKAGGNSRDGCEAFCGGVTARVAGYENSGFATAIAHFNYLNQKGLIHKDTNNIPIGAIVFYGPNQANYKAGHVGIVLGDNLIASNDTKGGGGYSVFAAGYFGIPLGWAYPDEAYADKSAPSQEMRDLYKLAA